MPYAAMGAVCKNCRLSKNVWRVALVFATHLCVHASLSFIEVECRSLPCLLSFLYLMVGRMYGAVCVELRRPEVGGWIVCVRGLCIMTRLSYRASCMDCELPCARKEASPFVLCQCFVLQDAHEFLNYLLNQAAEVLEEEVKQQRQQVCGCGDAMCLCQCKGPIFNTAALLPIGSVALSTTKA